MGEGVGDQRGGVGEQEGGADPLQHAPHDQHRRIGREARPERGECEQEEAADVSALAPEEIREPARHQHEHGGRDQVGEDHPHECEQRECSERSRSGSAMISVPELVAASSIPRLVQESAHHL